MPENIFCLSIFANDDRVSRRHLLLGAATLLAGHGSFLSVQQKDQFYRGAVPCIALLLYASLFRAIASLGLTRSPGRGDRRPVRQKQTFRKK